MKLTSIHLQQFRNYEKAAFSFSPEITVIVGRNTAGKTNLLDSIHLLSTGKSFLSETEEELIRFGYNFARIKGKIEDEEKEETLLEILIAQPSEMSRGGKKYLVNDIPKRRGDFSTHLPTLLFTPVDIEIIIGGPSHRRNFLDQVLEQVDQEYKKSLQTYTKAIRQRNALLEHAKETGIRNEKQFQYWDELLIARGSYIHQKRQEFIDYVNHEEKQIISCHMGYDHSVISEERLLQYREAETGAGVTLVGPHRDDVEISLQIENNKKKTETKNVRQFASRGQQRLIILQMKILQLHYMKERLETAPLLLLDDIFSELDTGHINLVSQMVGEQQTIITTTHEEFVNRDILSQAKVIELDK